MKVGVPFSHAISPNLRVPAEKYGVPLISAKSMRLSPMIPFARAKRDLCVMRHCDKSIGHIRAVVYKTPFHTGQTSRCPNDRLKKLKRQVINNAMRSEVRNLDASSAH